MIQKSMFLALATAAVVMAPQTSLSLDWNQLSAKEQTELSEFKKQWGQFSDRQQRSLQKHSERLKNMPEKTRQRFINNLQNDKK